MHLLRQIAIAFVKLRLRDGVLGQKQFQRLDLTVVQIFVRMLLFQERLFFIHYISPFRKEVPTSWYIGGFRTAGCIGNGLCGLYASGWSVFYDHSAFGFNGYSLIESRAGRDMGSYSFLLPCVMAAYV